MANKYLGSSGAAKLMELFRQALAKKAEQTEVDALKRRGTVCLAAARPDGLTEQDLWLKEVN